MAVVNIRKMQMLVRGRRVTMTVFVRLGTLPRKILHVLTVFVMNVPVRMLDCLMRVFMRVVLGQVKPHAIKPTANSQQPTANSQQPA
jgi:hypothetical protein